MNNQEAIDFVKEYKDYAGEAYLQQVQGKKVSKKFLRINQDRMDAGLSSHRDHPEELTKTSSVKISKNKAFFFFVKEHLTCKEIRLVRLLMRGHSKEECANLIKFRSLDPKFGGQVAHIKELKKKGFSHRDAQKESSKSKYKSETGIGITQIYNMISSIREKLEVVPELSWVL